MEFLLAGIDARQWPAVDWISADCSEWEVDEHYNNILIQKFKLEENILQLLGIDSREKLRDVIDFVRMEKKFNLAILGVLKSIVDYDYKGLKFEPYEINISSIESDLIFRGYDVCDLDGFFTILNGDAVVGKENENKLVTSINSSLEIAHDANIYSKSHEPFSIVKVLTAF